ncbi:MAG: hypothetical protein KF734_16100 [Saprospiraceae bacterium]|nr:hypothetical protein [Saprospiraceae bacterium]
MLNKKIALHTFLLALLFAGLFVAGCKDNDDGTEQENITTVVLHFIGPGFDREFEWNDLDGPGGNAPTVQTIELPPLTGNITCRVHVYDRSKTPAEDITEEIEEEADEHLVVYIPDASVSATWSYDDTDSKGKPLGIKTKWQTNQPSAGNLRVILYHEPTNKDNLSNPGGEVDFDVTFPVRIQ